MPFNPFRPASQKADEDFQRAYEKGVNLGPAHWQDAYQYFMSASRHYIEAGEKQKSSLASSLGILFKTLTSPTPEAWKGCSEAMRALGSTELNVGFATDSLSVANQAAILAEETALLPSINAATADTSKAAKLKDLAKRYMDLSDSDLSLWKLMRKEIDPRSRAYYLLGLASLIEANSFANSDPGKSVVLFSNAMTNFELAGADPLSARKAVSDKIEDLSRIAKCWFCGRRVQGRNIQFFDIKAEITPYMRLNYGNEMPTSIDGSRILVCKACNTAINNLADLIAQSYYQMVMRDLAALANRVSRLETEIVNLDSKISYLSSRISYSGNR